MITKLTPEDLYFWQSQMKDVQPLPKPAKSSQEFKKGSRSLPSAQKTQNQSMVKKIGAPSLSTALQTMNRKIMRRLHIDARLDLHGFTLAEGYQVLQNFLKQAQEKGLKTVLIITGKGSMRSPHTLRRQFPQWLEDPPLRELVLYRPHPAKPQDGGDGAFYVIVKKKIV